VYVEGGDNIESYVAFCSWIPNSTSFHLVWHYAGDAEPMVNGVGGEGREEEEEEREEQPDKLVKPEKPAKKIRVTYEEYRTIANLLILHLRQVEETSEEGVFFTNTCDDLAGKYSPVISDSPGLITTVLGFSALALAVHHTCCSFHCPPSLIYIFAKIYST